MTTIDELQTKVSELQAEAEALPKEIKAAISGGGDGKRLAALVARKNVLPLLIVEGECVLLEAQIASWESELPSLDAGMRLARDRAIRSADAARVAQTASGVAMRDGTRAQNALEKLRAKVRDGRDRLWLLRAGAARDLAVAANGKQKGPGWSPKP